MCICLSTWADLPTRNSRYQTMEALDKSVLECGMSFKASKCFQIIYHVGYWLGHHQYHHASHLHLCYMLTSSWQHKFNLVCEITCQMSDMTWTVTHAAIQPRTEVALIFKIVLLLCLTIDIEYCLCMDWRVIRLGLAVANV